MVRKTGVQSQVEFYQRLKKWCLILRCLTLSIIRYVSRIKWSNPWKGVAPSTTPRCSSYWKESLRVSLYYCRQLYLLFERFLNKSSIHIYIYIYIYIYIAIFLIYIFYVVVSWELFIYLFIHLFIQFYFILFHSFNFCSRSIEFDWFLKRSIWLIDGENHNCIFTITPDRL